MPQVTANPGLRRNKRKPPPRPRDDLILDALERLLADTPLRDLGVEEIANAAGIIRTRFYHYFESKHHAYAALLERVIGLVLKTFEEPVGWYERRPDVRPRAAMQLTFKMVVDVWWEHRAVLREASDMWNAPDEVRQLWLGMMSTFADRAAQAIDRERQREVAPPGPPADELADVLLWHGERALFLAMLEPDPVKAQARLDAIRNTTSQLWLRMVYLQDDPEPAPN